MIRLTIQHINRLEEAINVIGRVIDYSGLGMPKCEVKVRTTGIPTFVDIDIVLEIDLVSDIIPHQVLEIIKQEMGGHVGISVEQIGGDHK